jgi:hypothetical protein
MAKAALYGAYPAAAFGGGQFGLAGMNPIDATALVQQQIVALSANSVQRATALHPIWYDATLKPLTGLYFDNSYTVTLTNLTCQKGIDLTGASTP